MFDKESGLGEGGEPMLVKAVVAEGAVEAFNESVLHGLSRLDVMKGNVHRLSPEMKGFAGKLRAVVQSDHLWQGTGESEFLKHIDDGGTTDGGIDMDGQALTGKVIDNGQTTESASTGELIVDEVHRPTLIGTLRLRQRDASQGRQLFSTPTAQGETFFTVDAFGAFVVTPTCCDRCVSNSAGGSASKVIACPGKRR